MGSALAPNRAVTVLCNITVEISNGSRVCSKLGASADEDPATCDCASPGGATVVVGDEDPASSAEAEADVAVEDTAASAVAEAEDDDEDPAPSTELACTATVLPAAVGAEPAASPPAVSVAESMLATLDEAAMADGAPAVGLPPAMTVTCEPAAEACVCSVVGAVPMLPIAEVWSWKG